ncbi:4'-phosphopantetheinyl transferase superfamily protein [Streptomyces sp. NPDC050388]|uniref:4'-phosphopantetheinyl transferase family protein n=1 Tax=Streptomyces sp. NPDC050388 TaxID=3155781 RepID=UPI003447E13C
MILTHVRPAGRGSEVVLRTGRSQDVLGPLGGPAARTKALLSAAERRRYSRMRTAEGRQDFLAVRVLARGLIEDVTGVPADAVALAQSCPGCGSEGHGPPRALNCDVQLSWAHSGGEVVVALSERQRVGVDIESLEHFSVTPALLAAALPVAEAEQVLAAGDTRRAFLRMWTVKEALAKLGSDVMTMTRRDRRQLADSVGAVAHWTEDHGSSVVGVAVAARADL